MKWIIKKYRRLFESKNKSQKKIYSKQLIQFQGDAKKCGKHHFCQAKLLLKTPKWRKIKKIIIKFNNFIIDIGQELEKKIPRPARSFKSYVPQSNSTMPIAPINVHELKNPSF